jgi:hypothetical protein
MPVPAKRNTDKTVEQAFRMPEPEFEQIFRHHGVCRAGYWARYPPSITTRLRLTLVLLPIAIAIVVSLIADLDSPSRGLIRLDQRALQRLKADMSTEAEH